MDKLHDSLLLQILSRLDDSADVARCRVASKAFNTVFPGLRSINLRCKRINLRSSDWRKLLVDIIQKLEIVESVRINILDDTDYILMNANDWLPRVSGSLNSLAISRLSYEFNRRKPNIFPLISVYCHNLVELKLGFEHLSLQGLNPMPMLSSLTLELINFNEENLNELNKCLPNLQVLNLVGIGTFNGRLKIHLLNLKTCHLVVYSHSPSLTLFTPNLITLKIQSLGNVQAHVEAPMLSHFHFSNIASKRVGTLTINNFANLKTLLLDSLHIGFLLTIFPITKTVETLSLYSRTKGPRDAPDLPLTLEKVFKAFPNVSSLCINSSAWSKIEACINSSAWSKIEAFLRLLGGMILDGRKGLKTICAYLMLVNPSLTFSSVACVLDQCVGLSEVSFLIHGNVVRTESESFKSKCMARWPWLKWRWGIWVENMEDSWIRDGM